MLRRTGPTPRAGFTLVELLVVISIIAILAALTLAGLSRARHQFRATQSTNDIRGLDEAVTAFKSKMHLAPPAYIVETATDGNRYLRRFQPPHRTDMPEYRIMTRMWPRWDPANQGGVAADGVTILPAFQPARVGQPMDCNQVMVYFLGGPTNQGWSPAGPVAPSGNTKIAPFYEFPNGDTLVSIAGAAPRYTDPYGIPYAYFSANTDNDRYDDRAHLPWTPDANRRDFAWGNQIEVAPTLYNPATDLNPTKTAHPLRSPGNPAGSANGKWLAAGRWQIISAGKDKMFGFGGARLAPPGPLLDGIADYMPAVGDYEAKRPGEDDLSNFASGILGAN